RIIESPRHHRYRRPHGTLKGSREVVFAITDLNAHQFSPAELAVHSRGHWTMEDPVHHPRAVSIKEDARRTRTRNAPVVLGCLTEIIRQALTVTRWKNLASGCNPELTLNRTRHSNFTLSPKNRSHGYKPR